MITNESRINCCCSDDIVKLVCKSKLCGINCWYLCERETEREREERKRERERNRKREKRHRERERKNVCRHL